MTREETFSLPNEQTKENRTSYTELLKLHREKYPDEAKEADTWRDWWKKELNRLGVPKEEADAFFPALTD